MKLQLHWHETAKRNICAALLHGSSPAEWLRQMQAWNVSPLSLSCFVLPQNMRHLEASGLLVVFGGKLPDAAEGGMLLNPYGRIAGKLYLPVQASLSPGITDVELDKILLYDIQVFHPSIGLVGYDKEDQLEISRLLAFAPPQHQNWYYAVPPNLPDAHLTHVKVNMPPPVTLMEQAGGDIGSQPLDGLQPDGKESEAEQPPQGFFGRLSKMLGFGGTESPRKDDVQKKRESEMNRLMKLFESDPEEALKYAIPLDSPYIGRGTASPGSLLPRNDINFSLSGLGGGRATDYWDAEKFRASLRQKYLDQANEAIRKGDYRKAAYIHAKLLGDYNSAANVLRQGKHYREAAALYNDHLKNKAMAALCLEEGGHYLEAIDFYLELGKKEKAADLYVLAEMTKQANLLYEECVQDELRQNNHLGAAQILLNKLNDAERAREVHLRGWKTGSGMAEECLKQYLKAGEWDAKQCSREIKSIYAETTSAEQRYRVLHVLNETLRNTAEEVLKTTMRDIAFDAAEEGMKNGNPKPLQMLPAFVREDSLLAPDISRYLQNRHRARAVKPEPVEPRKGNLDLVTFRKIKTYVNWKVMYRQTTELIVLGFEAIPTRQGSSKLVIARVGDKGGIEYHEPGVTVANVCRPVIMAHELNQKVHLLVSGLGAQASFSLKMHGNSQFGEMMVEHPSWLPDRTVCVCPEGRHDSHFAVLHASKGSGELQISRYSERGKLRSTQPVEPVMYFSFVHPGEMGQVQTYSQGCMYHEGPFLHRIRFADGKAETMVFQERITGFMLQYTYTKGKLVVSTVNGSYVFDNFEAGVVNTDERFTTEEAGSLLSCIPTANLVALRDNELSVYDLADDKVKRIAKWKHDRKKITDFCNSYQRNQIEVLMEEDGIYTLRVVKD